MTDCSHSGKTNVGTQAPPSITRTSVARMATPRVASGVLPSAAMSRPKVEARSAKAKSTPAKPIMLPSIRTPKTAIAAAKMPASNSSAITVPETIRLPRRSMRDMGAARSRFQMPRRRMRSTPTPSSIPMKRTNCTPMPAKECA